MRTFLVLAIFLNFIGGPALADGVFGGDNGLIRGDVGNFLDKNLEQPVLTPWARKTTEGLTTGVGTYIGGPIGGAVGEYVGKAINERAAGEATFARPTQYNYATPKTAQKGNLLFQIRNSANNRLMVRFYSGKRGVVWPNTNEAYILDYGKQYGYAITCELGELVCFGAYLPDRKATWGFGATMNNDKCERAPGCCLRCENTGDVTGTAAWNLTNN